MPRVATTNIINNPKRYGYDVRVDTLLLRSAVGPGREMTIQSSDVQEAQINVKQNAEDFTSNLGRIYSRNNFTGGQGLDTAHRADGTPKDTTRFWDSKGVDVFHGDDETSYNVHLLFTTAAESINFSGTNNYLTQTTNGDLYVTDQAVIYKSTDNGDTWAAVTTGLTIDYNFTGAAAVGDQVYFTTADGTSNSELIQYDGTTWTATPSLASARNALAAFGADATAGLLGGGVPVTDTTQEFTRSINIITGGAWASGGNLNKKAIKNSFFLKKTINNTYKKIISNILSGRGEK